MDESKSTGGSVPDFRENRRPKRNGDDEFIASDQFVRGLTAVSAPRKCMRANLSKAKASISKKLSTRKFQLPSIILQTDLASCAVMKKWIRTKQTALFAIFMSGRLSNQLK